MRFMTFDLAGTVGWAAAEDRIEPIHGSKRLPKTDMGYGPFLRVFAKWAAGVIDDFRPDLVTYESPILPKKKRTIETLRALYCLGPRLEEVCDERNLKCTERDFQSVRTHFLGAGNVPTNTDDIKDAIMAKCRYRGWDPVDHNAGDALALLDFIRACRIPGWANQGLPLLAKVTP